MSWRIDDPCSFVVDDAVDVAAVVGVAVAVVIAVAAVAAEEMGMVYRDLNLVAEPSCVST